MEDQALMLQMKAEPEKGIERFMEQFAGLVYSIVSGRAGSAASQEPQRRADRLPLADAVWRVADGGASVAALRVHLLSAAGEDIVRQMSRSRKGIDRILTVQPSASWPVAGLLHSVSPFRPSGRQP